MPESEQLYDAKYAAYRSRLLSIISLLYLKDWQLAFLTLVTIGGGASAVGMTRKIVDVACPLIPKALATDQGTQGFGLYEDLTLQDFLLKDVEAVFDYNLFIETVDSIIVKIPDVGNVYASAACLLVQSLSHLPR